jgi:hypothetical protein
MLVALLLLAVAIQPDDCRVGAYRLDDGSLVTIDPSGEELRWHRLDGTMGVLHPAAGGSFTSTLGFTGRDDGKKVAINCGTIVFDKVAGRRIDFDLADTVFRSGAVQLAGRLVLPKGDGPVPIVVLVHGSENYSGRDRYLLQRLLPAEGVGVFVYDKRGTGQSKGEYTHDFNLLADDAAAAVREARRMAGRRAGRVGFHGGSQDGYVAPLAATRTPVDFVSVGFGLAVSPLEEDREEIILEMKLKHHSQAEIDKGSRWPPPPRPSSPAASPKASMNSTPCGTSIAASLGTKICTRLDPRLCPRRAFARHLRLERHQRSVNLFCHPEAVRG